jgi:hypothetical protein
MLDDNDEAARARGNNTFRLTRPIGLELGRRAMIHATPIAAWMFTIAANRLSLTPAAKPMLAPKRVRGRHINNQAFK